MLARLGSALYWIGSGLAAVITVLAVWGLFGPSEERLIGFVILLIFAALIWLTGRGCRYVLTGR
jgi:hypothetical protein